MGDDHVYFANKEIQNRKRYVVNNFTKRMFSLDIIVRKMKHTHFKDKNVKENEKYGITLYITDEGKFREYQIIMKIK